MSPRKACCAWVAAAALTILAVVPSASGAAGAPQITDPAGDANGINTQQAVDGDPHGVITPKEIDMLDILSVRFATGFAGATRKRAVSLDVTMTVAANPAADDNVLRRYAVRFSVGKCAGTTVLWDVTRPANETLPSPRDMANVLKPGSYFQDGCTGAVSPLGYSRMAGNTVVFRVPLSMIGKPGTKLTKLDAYTSLRVRDRTPLPRVDVAAGPIDTYTIGR